MTERLKREEIDELAMERVLEGRFRVGEDGSIESLQRDGSWKSIGTSGNTRQNIVVNFMIEGGVYRVQAGRLAWAIHYREWPPTSMSVMMVNGNKRDFSRANLALVPRGQENRVKAALAE